MHAISYIFGVLAYKRRLANTNAMETVHSSLHPP
jgi:hypothetical protein